MFYTPFNYSHIHFFPRRKLSLTQYLFSHKQFTSSHFPLFCIHSYSFTFTLTIHTFYLPPLHFYYASFRINNSVFSHMSAFTFLALIKPLKSHSHYSYTFHLFLELHFFISSTSTRFADSNTSIFLCSVPIHTFSCVAVPVPQKINENSLSFFLKLCTQPAC